MAQEINEMNIEKLREEVNPVYSTAHSCLQLVAATGDEDSENLRKVLGFTKFGEDKEKRGAKVRTACIVQRGREQGKYYRHMCGYEESGIYFLGRIACTSYNEKSLGRRQRFQPDQYERSGEGDH